MCRGRAVHLGPPQPSGCRGPGSATQLLRTWPRGTLRGPQAESSSCHECASHSQRCGHHKDGQHEHGSAPEPTQTAGVGAARWAPHVSLHIWKAAQFSLMSSFTFVSSSLICCSFSLVDASPRNKACPKGRAASRNHLFLWAADIRSIRLFMNKSFFEEGAKQCHAKSVANTSGVLSLTAA